MKLSPAHISAMYECLRQLPPFAAWKLPEASEIEFRAPNVAHHGEFISPNIITVSSRTNGHLDTILQTLAHEMCHLKAGLKVRNPHGPEFKRLAKKVCATFGWDASAF